MHWTIERHPVLSSTNERAVERIRAGAAKAGEVIVAAAQTAGRGRRARRWHDAPGALLMTAILPPPDRELQWLGLTVAIAVAAALRKQEVPAGLKWPNDVVLKRRKVARILVELPAGCLAAAGIGINVNNPVQSLPDWGEQATSLAEHLGRPLDLEHVLAGVLSELERIWPALLAGESLRLLEMWRALDATSGRRVRLLPGGADGVAAGIGPDGMLQVRTGGAVLHTAAVDEVEFLG